MNKVLITGRNNAEVFSFLLTLLTIWMSRTVFFGMINQKIILTIYCICIFIACIFLPAKIKRIKYIVTRMTLPLFLFLINILWCLPKMNQGNLNAVLGYILILFCGALTAILVTPQMFAKNYICILFCYCIVSIPCVIVANLDGNLALKLCQSGYNWTSSYGYSFYYTWGANGAISLRNSGPFWEPGAFQGYIWIAILLLLFNIDKGSIKQRKRLFLIFLIVLLTTKSTTGYFLIVIGFLFFNDRILRLFGIEIKNSNTKAAILLFTVLIGVIFLTMSTVITNKIGNESNVSTQMRKADILIGSHLIINAGPLGLGETEERNAMRAALGLYKDDSAGLIQITYTFGWLMGIYYLISLCGIAKKLFNANTRTETIGISIVMIILHLTEGLWSLPLFWLLLFENSERNTV